MEDLCFQPSQPETTDPYWWLFFFGQAEPNTTKRNKQQSITVAVTDLNVWPSLRLLNSGPPPLQAVQSGGVAFQGSAAQVASRLTAWHRRRQKGCRVGFFGCFCRRRRRTELSQKGRQLWREIKATNDRLGFDTSGRELIMRLDRLQLSSIFVPNSFKEVKLLRGCFWVQTRKKTVKHSQKKKLL